MVGPQQTTGLIGQKWKTGNGWELTGTNRPTQTTPPHTHPPATRTAGREQKGTGGRQQLSARRPLYGPHPTHPPTTPTPRWAVAKGSGRPHHTTESTTRDGTALPIVVSVVTATGKRPAPSRTRKLSLTAPMVLHPPGCGRVGHHRAHTTGIGSAFTNDVKADPILLFLLFAQCQWTYALSRYEIRRARNRAPRATPVLPGPATPMA